MRECRHCGSQSMLEDHWTCWFCLGLTQAQVTTVLWSFPQQGRNPKHILQSVSKSVTGLYYLSIDVLLFQSTRLKKIKIIYGVFYTLASCHLTVFANSIVNLLLSSHSNKIFTSAGQFLGRDTAQNQHIFYRVHICLHFGT